MPVSLSVHQPPDDPEEEINLFELFPDPAEFIPPSPTFTFPPLPPSPPEIDETETITSSTKLTEIEVFKVKEEIKEPERRQKIEKTQKEAKPIKEHEKKKEKHSNKEKKKHKNLNQHLKVPQIQITQQVSSEREIVDSISLTKNKLERKDDKHCKNIPRKGKKRKEKRESLKRTPCFENDSEPFMDEYRYPKKEFCEKCYEKKSKRKREKDQKKHEEHLTNEPDDAFLNRHIEEKEVLRRYIDTDKVYEDTLSNKSSYCGCSLHAEENENESPQKLSKVKLEQVRDAVLVARNWKHSNVDKKSS